MNILHYSLGISPWRTGGLTKYSWDLMLNEKQLGNNIILLYPGKFTIDKSQQIKKKHSKKSINIYEIINPSLVTLMGGVKKPESIYIDNNNFMIYKKFFEEIRPDIIHIHTLMGLSKSFIDTAKILNIKLVYTTHDYYGICPTVNQIDYNGDLCNDYCLGKKCVICNSNGYSNKMIYLMQSNLYRKIKNNKVVSILKTRKKNEIKKIDNKIHVNSIEDKEGKKYIKLREYYLDILSKIDHFHFNSSISKKEYNKYLKNIDGSVIGITHSDIKDKRKILNTKNKTLNLLYLGPMKKYKGFDLLIETLEKLRENNMFNWKLNIYGDLDETIELNNDFYSINGRYKYEDLSDIFNKADLLIIPSIWKETYGLIGLEAICHGVPVLISENVGFKDFVESEKLGIVFNLKQDELYNTLLDLCKSKNRLYELNKNILNYKFDIGIEKHTEKIIEMYKLVLDREVIYNGKNSYY